MRLPWGSLTRRLPETVAQPEDVVIGHVDDEGWYVAPASQPGALWSESILLTEILPTRKAAREAAWRLAGLRGGRLLDYQRSTLAEQPLRWEVTVHASPEQLVRLDHFEKGSNAREHLSRALAVRFGMNHADACWASEQVVRGHGRAQLPLTQSEIKRAALPMAPMRPITEIVFGLLRFARVDVHPAHLLYRESV